MGIRKKHHIGPSKVIAAMSFDSIGTITMTQYSCIQPRVKTEERDLQSK